MGCGSSSSVAQPIGVIPTATGNGTKTTPDERMSQPTVDATQPLASPIRHHHHVSIMSGPGDGVVSSGGQPLSSSRTPSEELLQQSTPPINSHPLHLHPSSPPQTNGLGNGTGSIRGRPGSRVVYAPEHASSVPVPRPSVISKQPLHMSRVETERPHPSRPHTQQSHHQQHQQYHNHRPNMPSVNEMLLSVKGLNALPIRNALLPNFYRSAGAFSSAGGQALGDNLQMAGGFTNTGDGDDTSVDESLLWSDEEDDMDDEEHRETMDMLQELTMLSVPTPAPTLKAHNSASNSSDPPAAGASIPGSPSQSALQRTPVRSPTNQDATNNAASNDSPTLKQTSPLTSLVQKSSPILTSGSALPVHHRPTPSTNLAVPGSPGMSATTPPPMAPRAPSSMRRAHINSAGTETLFHGFYAKRCIHTVKKSMASSGMFMTFKDMFDRLDTTHSGFISRQAWAELLQKLGLPVDSATSLSRIIGLADTSTITLEQFAMVMALSMHGPYVRLLQSTQNAKRNEIFLGGDQSSESPWRKEAIAIFTKNKVPFFNPASPSTTSADSPSHSATAGGGQEWNAELVILAALAKTQSTMMLFVVDSATRSIAAMVEASEHITSEKEVLMVMQDVAAGSNLGGDEVVTGPEAKDLNRGRAYLADVAHRNAHSGVIVFKTIAEACDYIVKRNSGLIVRPSLKAFTKPVLALPTAMPPSAPTTTVSAPSVVPSSLPPQPPRVIAPPSASKFIMPPASSASNTNSPSKTEELTVTVPLAQDATHLRVDQAAATLATANQLGLNLAFLNGVARRHTGGASPRAKPSPSSFNFITPPSASVTAATTGAVSSASATTSTATTPIASTVASSPPSSTFPIEDWPTNPQPADFDRYLASTHFSECTRIVFKHQVLLSRRAAVKAAQLSVNNLAPLIPINGTSSTGSPVVMAGPPGLFRMASSPMLLLKTKSTASSSNLMMLPELTKPNPPVSVNTIPETSSMNEPSQTTSGLHVSTGSPQTHDQAASTPSHSHKNSGSPNVKLADLSPTHASGSKTPPSSTANNPMFSESFNGTSQISSALSQTKVLVRIGSHSEAEGENAKTPQQRNSVSQPTHHGNKESFSSMIGITRTGTNTVDVSASPSTTRPTTSGNNLTSSSSQSRLLDPMTVAGLTVNIAPPPSSSTSDAANPTVTTATSITPSITPSNSLPLDEMSESVSTTHLFTMLIRLHEIIQLATGISFLHPYPNLVATELEALGDRVTDVLRVPEWSLIAKKVFGQLRGIHEEDHILTKQKSLKDSEGAAAPSTPQDTDNKYTVKISEAAAAAATSPTITTSGSAVASTPNGDLAAAATSANRRRSATRFSMPRNVLLNAAPASDLSATTGSALGLGISPSQFLRHLSTAAGSSKRSTMELAAGGPASTVDGDGASVTAVSSPATRPAYVHRGSISVSARALLDMSTGVTLPPPNSAEKKVLAPSNSLAILQRVKGRISAQRKVIESLSSLSGLGGGAKSVSPLEEANTLSPEDLKKLAASVQASLQHDQLLLKEMSPSFDSMYKAIDSIHKKGTVSMEDVMELFSKKLLLPMQSCESLMGVINVALVSCQQDAEAGAADLSSTAASTGEASFTPPPPLPTSAFSRTAISFPAFTAVLSKTLHLQSSPFSSFLSSSGNFLTASRKVCSQVFLGGSCNPTTWRMDEAIPILNMNNITYYNPQVDNWSNELVLIESLIKQNCEILLFVIDSETRAIASMIEASEYICSGRDVVLVVKDLPQIGAKVNNEVLGRLQVHDLNRGRSYVTDVAQRHGLDVFTDITLACEYIVTKLKEKQSKEEQYAAEVESFISSDEFIEKTYEEFFRCDLTHSSTLNSQQLLLACLHLEQDLRPLLPPQSSKHRQPCASDVEMILNKFGTPGSRELTCEQFLDFSRVLFRNVCAHVKL